MKTVVRKYRGFESYSLRQRDAGPGLADGYRPERSLGANKVSLPLSRGGKVGLITVPYPWCHTIKKERWPSWLKAHAC